jgi:hypothetical protein
MQQKFRLDKTAFEANDADNHIKYWKDKSYSERLQAAWFLIQHAYGIDNKTRMDKTVFEKRKR